MARVRTNVGWVKSYDDWPERLSGLSAHAVVLWHLLETEAHLANNDGRFLAVEIDAIEVRRGLRQRGRVSPSAELLEAGHLTAIEPVENGGDNGLLDVEMRAEFMQSSTRSSCTKADRVLWLVGYTDRQNSAAERAGTSLKRQASGRKGGEQFAQRKAEQTGKQTGSNEPSKQESRGLEYRDITHLPTTYVGGPEPSGDDEFLAERWATTISALTIAATELATAEQAAADRHERPPIGNKTAWIQTATRNLTAQHSDPLYAHAQAHPHLGPHELFGHWQTQTEQTQLTPTIHRWVTDRLHAGLTINDLTSAAETAWHHPDLINIALRYAAAQ
jgi:hypothetical protein